MSLKASKPNVCAIDDLVLDLTGLLTGSTSAYNPAKNEIIAPIKKGVEYISKPNALINRPEPIQPDDPNNLIRENSLPASVRFAKEIEFVNDIVGIKQILYNKSTGKNSEKVSIFVSQNSNIAPTIFRKANTLFAEKNLSAIIPTIIGDIMAAMAAVL